MSIERIPLYRVFHRLWLESEYFRIARDLTQYSKRVSDFSRVTHLVKGKIGTAAGPSGALPAALISRTIVPLPQSVSSPATAAGSDMLWACLNHRKRLELFLRVGLAFLLFPCDPLCSRLQSWQCWERWLTIIGRRWFSVSSLANHISHGCHPSSPALLPKPCWKSLRWPCLLLLKSDPKGFLCTQAPSALHSRPCHVTIIPNHVSFGQSACTWLGEIAPVRVRSVCSCTGLWERFSGT